MSLDLFLSQLIEDLRKQLEHLQLYKLEAEAKRGRTPGAGLQEYQTRTREAELEQEIKRLKQVYFQSNFLPLYSFNAVFSHSAILTRLVLKWKNDLACTVFLMRCI